MCPAPSQAVLEGGGSGSLGGRLDKIQYTQALGTSFGVPGLNKYTRSTNDYKDRYSPDVAD